LIGTEEQVKGLTRAEVESYHDQGHRASGRYYCPIHGGDHRYSFQLFEHEGKGRFKCHNCEAWGYLADYSDNWKDFRPIIRTPARRPYSPVSGTRTSNTHIRKAVDRPVDTKEGRGKLTAALKAYRAAFADSIGAEYLSSRSIPPALAATYGAGYCTQADWIGSGYSKQGWLVLPHTEPGGTVTSLYGRGIGIPTGSDEAHRHLPAKLYPKGYFNAPVMIQGTGPLYICEGPIDALSLILAGKPRTIAIFGADDIRWEWFAAVDDLIFAFDADKKGTDKTHDHARAAHMEWGKRVRSLTAEHYGGYNDVNDALVNGALRLT